MGLGPNDAMQSTSDVDLLNWAEQSSTAACDKECRLKSALGEDAASNWWKEVNLRPSHVCWGCDMQPWPHERQYASRVWSALHAGHIPIRRVSQATNLWSVPCNRGIESRSASSRCLIGHFVYAVLCFFRWMGESQEPYALLSLESAMDLAWLVDQAPCSADWGFSVPEVAANYERFLTTVWHLHQEVPEYWEAAQGPLQCWRPRLREPQELLEGAQLHNQQMPKVFCLVLSVLPSDEDRMSMVTDTYADYCQSLAFIVASDAPEAFRGYPVIDLRKYFNIAPDPVAQGWSAGASSSNNHTGERNMNVNFNTIEKTIYAFLLAAIMSRDMSDKPDIFCRLDSDTLFIPDNLRRIVVCRNFSFDEPWALGYANYAHKHQQPGRAFFNGGTGVCVSRGALEVLLEREVRGDIKKSHLQGDWNLGSCVSVPGHWDDVVFASCLAQFGVPFSRWGTDCFGRDLFWPHRLERALPGPQQITPARVPPRVTYFHPPKSLRRKDIEQDVGVANYHHWRYRVWQHVACNSSRWLGDFPVSFHPYRNGTLARETFKRLAFEEDIQGYGPRIWDGSLAQCYDLLC